MPGTARPVPGVPHGLPQVPRAGVISDVDIAALARGAGIPDAQIPTAVAIALAESGGNASAQNHNSNGTVDHGLWQINDVNLAPLRLTAQQVLIPEYNAQAMATLSNSGSNWSPWTTYTSGKYKAYMSRGKAAAKAQNTNTFDQIGSDISGAVNSLTQPFGDIASAISFLFSKQFLYIIGGGVLLVVAILLIARNNGVKVPKPPIVPV